METEKKPIDIDQFSLCKVVKEDVTHYFNVGTYCYFSGEIRKCELTGEYVYGLIGKLDGHLVKQFLEHHEFIIFKTIK